jgi:hypothetical protein
VHCGTGADRARLDRGDIVRSCETRRYGEYQPPDPPDPPWAQRVQSPGVWTISSLIPSGS